jgi:hypothetical protein
MAKQKGKRLRSEGRRYKSRRTTEEPKRDRGKGFSLPERRRRLRHDDENDCS